MLRTTLPHCPSCHQSPRLLGIVAPFLATWVRQLNIFFCYFRTTLGTWAEICYFCPQLRRFTSTKPCPRQSSPYSVSESLLPAWDSTWKSICRGFLLWDPPNLSVVLSPCWARTLPWKWGTGHFSLWSAVIVRWSSLPIPVHFPPNLGEYIFFSPEKLPPSLFLQFLTLKTPFYGDICLWITKDTFFNCI